MMPRKAFTISEVAEMFGRNRTTVWRWLKTGGLEYFTAPNGRRMISAATLERLVGEPLPDDVVSEPEPPRIVKRGRPPRADRPWEAEGVSRRTWKRRQAHA